MGTLENQLLLRHRLKFATHFPRCTLDQYYFDLIKNFVLENWTKPRGLIVATILELLTIPAILSEFPFANLGIPSTISIYIIAGATLLAILFTTIRWFFYPIPKGDSDKINIGICIHAEDKDALMVHTDFVKTLERLIADNDPSRLFNVIIYPQTISKDISSKDDAYAFGLRAKLVMVIWGRAFTRPHKDEPVQHLAIQSMLFHRTFTPTFQQKLTNRFGNVMPRGAQFAISQSTAKCEFTASQAHLGVKLMISLLAIVYGDFVNAERWLIELNSVRQVLPQVKREIKKQTQELYLTWLETIGVRLADYRDRQDLSLVPRLWESYRRHGGNSLSATCVRAQAYVLLDRDAGSANQLFEVHSKEMKSSKTSQVYWFSRAFCYAYLDDLNKAYRAYKIGMSSTQDVDNAALQCEEFINEILSEEPGQTQLYFCLGFLNYRVKKDHIAARRDLSTFLAKTPRGEQEWAHRIASEWLDKLNALDNQVAA